MTAGGGDSSSRPSGWLRLWIIFCFAAPAVHHFSSVAPSFREAAIGASGDIPVHVWSLWHTARSLALQGESVFFTQGLLAPLGTTLVYNTTGLFPGLIAAPVYYAAGVFAAYNFILMFLTLFAGAGCYLLARRLTGSAAAAGFAAFVVEMSPALYFRLIAHWTLLGMGWIPLTIFLVQKILADAPAARLPRWSFWLGGACACLFFTDYNLFIYSALGGGASVVLHAIYAPAGQRTEALRRIVLMTGCAALPFLCAVLPFFLFSPFQDARFWRDDNPNPLYGRYLGSDIAFYFMPNPRYWLFSNWLPPKVLENAPIYDEQACYLGVLVMGLCAPGLVFLGKRNRPAFFTLLILGGLAAVISLGQKMIRFSYWVDLPPFQQKLLLFRYISEMPFFSQLRVPARWSMIVSLAAVLFSACGLEFLRQSLARPSARAILLLAAATIVFLEFAHKPTPLMRFNTPPAYQFIGKATNPHDMIIETPIGFLWGTGKIQTEPVRAWRMVEAIRHRYRIVSCYLSRISRKRAEWILSQPLMRDLWLAQGGDIKALGEYSPSTNEEMRAWAQANSVRFVLVEKGKGYEKICDWMEAIPWAAIVYSDNSYDVFELEPAAAQASRLRFK